MGGGKIILSRCRTYYNYALVTIESWMYWLECSHKRCVSRPRREVWCEKKEESFLQQTMRQYRVSVVFIS